MKKLIFVLALLCPVLFSFNITAGDITGDVDGPWLTFRYAEVGSMATEGLGCYVYPNAILADSPPWTFEAGPDGATVTILDTPASGDQFALYDNGNYVGTTSVPGFAEPCSGPDDCLDTGLSSGEFTLEVGQHSLTIMAVQSPYNVGCAWFRVDSGDTGSEIEVGIDIQPNKTVNKIRLDNDGLVSVAILTSDGFIATQVDPTTVRFGPAGAIPIARSTRVKDVDRDGDKDYLFRFIISETGIQCGDTEASLTGSLLDSQAIIGTDSITTGRCQPTTVVNGVMSNN